MDTITRIKDDHAFCLEDPEEFQDYRGQVAISKVMRTVAALNPEATRSQFLQAYRELGCNEVTIRRQFLESRQFDVQAYGGSIDAEGRYNQ